MHTVVPLFDRGLMLVTDESTENNAKDWPKLVWILDARDETNLVPIATCPLPDHKAYAARGRFGAHNIHENVPLPTCWHTDQVVLGTFFNGGLRAYDISNPYQPQAIATFVPPAPAGAPTGTIQLNDVFVDEREIVYASTVTSAGCTAWRWISRSLEPPEFRHAGLACGGFGSFMLRFTMTDTIFDLFPSASAAASAGGRSASAARGCR